MDSANCSDRTGTTSCVGQDVCEYGPPANRVGHLQLSVRRQLNARWLHRPVVAQNGLSVNPRHTIADCPKLDMLLVPGGVGSRTEMNNALLIDWIKRRADAAELVLSVCTGALLLGKAGLLDGLDVTTHHVGFDRLREVAPAATVHENRRFVDNGKIITSAGIAAGIDMSLHVVERLLGAEVAAATARHMEYPWEISPNEEGAHRPVESKLAEYEDVEELVIG